MPPSTFNDSVRLCRLPKNDIGTLVMGVIPNLCKVFFHASAVNCVPLSVVTTDGTPNLTTQKSKKVATTIFAF